jgi:hypothetical protein
LTTNVTNQHELPSRRSASIRVIRGKFPVSQRPARKLRRIGRFGRCEWGAVIGQYRYDGFGKLMGQNATHYVTAVKGIDQIVCGINQPFGG